MSIRARTFRCTKFLISAKRDALIFLELCWFLVMAGCATYPPDAISDVDSIADFEGWVESTWRSDVTSFHGAWRHAGLRFLLFGGHCPNLLRASVSAFESHAYVTTDSSSSASIAQTFFARTLPLLNRTHMSQREEQTRNERKPTAEKQSKARIPEGFFL
jgi:hypothetical protein